MIIFYLKIIFEKFLELNEEFLKEILRYEYIYVVYEVEMVVKEKVIWEEFFSIKKLYDKEFLEFVNFKEKYKYFEFKNSEELKK